MEITRKQIKELRQQEQLLYKNIDNINTTINTIQNKINKLYEKFTKCYSCGRNKDPENMIIATKEDVDNYHDKNDGFCGPEIGEYYCFC
jgi:septation ring formation regulator EzrA